MLEAKYGSARARLTLLVEQILAKNAVSAPISPDVSLTEAGLSSIDMVNLMLAIEADFDVMIPPSEITPESFRSIATVEAMLTRLGSHG